MLIKFYKFNDRMDSINKMYNINTNDTVQYDLEVKEDTDIIRPKIILSYKSYKEKKLNKYNFIYIPDFKRYYFYKLSFLTGNQIQMDLTEDLLTSFYQSFKHADLFVERARLNDVSGLNSIGLSYKDEMIPLGDTTIHESNRAQIVYGSGLVGGGASAVITLSAGGGSPSGANTFRPTGLQTYSGKSYILSGGGLYAFLTYLQSGTIMEVDSTLEGLLNALGVYGRAGSNPVDFIQDIMIFPFDVTGGVQETIMLGDKATKIKASPLHVFTRETVYRYKMNKTYLFESPDGTLGNTRWQNAWYFNTGEFITASLYLPFYGYWEVPKTFVGRLFSDALDANIDAMYSIDLRTGECTIDIGSYSTLNFYAKGRIDTLKINLGVHTKWYGANEVQKANFNKQATQSLVNMGTSATNSVIQGVTNPTPMGIASAVTGGIEGMYNSYADYRKYNDALVAPLSGGSGDNNAMSLDVMRFTAGNSSGSGAHVDLFAAAHIFYRSPCPKMDNYYASQIIENTYNKYGRPVMLWKKGYDIPWGYLKCSDIVWTNWDDIAATPDEVTLIKQLLINGVWNNVD